MDDERVKVDVIIVGGGPAGLTAALALAQAELDVIVVERGEYCGSKNVGGLLYGTVLEDLLPKFYEDAPIERPVSKRQLVFLGQSQQASLAWGSDEWTRPPYNYTYTVHRSQFDRWYAGKAEAAGANLLEGMVVDDLIYEGEGQARRAVGVRIRGDEEFFADAVVLCDGAHSILTRKVMDELGMSAGRHQQEYAIGVKEIVRLPSQVIEDRFGLLNNEGAAVDFIGVPFEGMIGGGFIYTQKETLALGFAARIESMQQAGVHAHDVMDAFKRHPEVAKYVRGGELLEYSAHMIPEGGYDAVPQLAANGVLIAGDAAGLVNMSLYKEGTNHAMESGRLAAKVLMTAKEKGDFSRASLAAYETGMQNSVALADLKKYRNLPEILEASPEVLSLYPAKATQVLVEYFTNAYEPKKAIQKRALKNFLHGLPKFKFVRDLIRARKLM